MLDLRALGLEPGDLERLTIPVEVAPIDLGGQRYVVGGGEPVEVALEVQRAVDGLHLRLRLGATLAGPCYRCTEPAEVAVAVDERQYHASAPVGGGDDTVSPHVSGDRLHVDAWAREAIVLALPAKILCRPGCAGLCPHCGRRLTEGEQHDCLAPQPDSRWAALEHWQE